MTRGISRRPGVRAASAHRPLVVERRCPPLPRPGAPHPAPWVRPSQPLPHPRPASTARGTHGPACPSGTAQGFLSGGPGGPGGVGRPRCVLAAPASPTQLTSRPTAPGFLVCSHRRPGLCSVQPNPSTWEVLARSVRWGERSCKELQLILLG